jgi:2-pyrone-4,6-dicarboxylate lactonase
VLVNRTLLLMAGMTTPPDPDTKVPRLRCPPGTIDAHLHLFGPKELYPIDPNSVYETADALPETLIGMHRVLGLSGGVLVSGGAYGRNPRHLLDARSILPTQT